MACVREVGSTQQTDRHWATKRTHTLARRRTLARTQPDALVARITPSPPAEAPSSPCNTNRVPRPSSRILGLADFRLVSGRIIRSSALRRGSERRRQRRRRFAAQRLNPAHLCLARTAGAGQALHSSLRSLPCYAAGRCCSTKKWVGVPASIQLASPLPSSPLLCSALLCPPFALLTPHPASCCSHPVTLPPSSLADHLERP